MNKFFSFFAASNRYKHLIGGFIVAHLPVLSMLPYMPQPSLHRASNSKTASMATSGTGQTGSAPFSAAASQHSCFTSYSQWYGIKGFLKTTKIA